MSRRGLVTIGVAVQAETFATDSGTNSGSVSGPTPFPSAAKSAILLPPNKDGSPQTLRITFGYNKVTNLPEIHIDIDGDNNRENNKYLELKELCRGNLEDFSSLPSNCETLESNPTEETQKSDIGDKTQVFLSSVTQDLKNPLQASLDMKATSDMKTTDEGNSTQSNSMLEFDFDSNDSGYGKIASNSGSSPENTARAKKNQQRESRESRGTSTSPLQRSFSPTKGVPDKSRIPVIQSSAAGLTPCEYYRKKMLEESGCTDIPSSWTPTYYSSIQRKAGRKVINKMAAEQKHLEELAAAQRKRTEFVLTDELGFAQLPEKFIVRKRPTKLEPLRPGHKCH